MANISTELAAIQSAILGREVRGSIHDAIFTINNVSEHYIDTGLVDPDYTPLYAGLKYINEVTWDVFESSASGSTFVWGKIGNIAGNSITEITGPVSSGLVDTYTIHFSKDVSLDFQISNGRSITRITGPNRNILVDTYTIEYNDGTTQTFDVTNGKGIVSIAKTATSGLTDTYTITYNDGTTQTYDIVNGKDGNTVLRGNEITGQATLPTQFTLSVKCQTGDTYINTSGYVYTCTQGAAANDNSLWKYDFAMTGGGGAQYLNDLQDVDTTGVQDGQYLRYDGQQEQFVPVTSSGSGHEMNPTPAANLTEADVVEAVNGVLALQNPGNNDQVASLFSIGKWSNTMTKKYFVQGIAGSSTPIGKSGIGKWCVDGSDETGWIPIPELVGIGSKSHTINITYDPSKSGVIIRGGYVIDDTTGKMCIKFANEISEADTHTAKIGIEITINNTEDNPVSWS